jgi:hypothetical protein
LGILPKRRLPIRRVAITDPLKVSAVSIPGFIGLMRVPKDLLRLAGIIKSAFRQGTIDDRV